MITSRQGKPTHARTKPKQTSGADLANRAVAELSAKAPFLQTLLCQECCLSAITEPSECLVVNSGRLSPSSEHLLAGVEAVFFRAFFI